MKRIIPILLMAGMICAFSGCSGNTSATAGESTPAQSSDSTPPEDSSAPEQAPAQESQESTAPENSITAQFETPAGDVPDLSDAVVDDGNVDISELTADNWNYVICQGSVYLAEPLGISYNSALDTEHYDSGSRSFTDVPETVTHEYRRYNVGDVIGGLTLKECRTTFDSYLGNSVPRYFGGGEAYFDGEITMSGVCCVVPETEGYDYQGDIHFIPNYECQLPVMNYSWNEDGTETVLVGGDDGVSWCSEYSQPINLGSSSAYPKMDLSAIPDDGTYVPVRVTVNNLVMRNDFNLTPGTGAQIVAIELL